MGLSEGHTSLIVIPTGIKIRNPQSPIKKRINAAKRLAVSTGQLRRLLALHTRPIDLVVFQEPTFPKEPETSSCGGFHAYMPSAFILAARWLPSAAPSGTTGTPEVRPSQSSRTREEAAQVSSAHNR